MPAPDPVEALNAELLTVRNQLAAAIARGRELEAQAADPLSVVLGNLDAGAVLADAGKQLGELCALVVKREAAGTLTIKLTVKPFQANATVITADVAVKNPKPEAAPSVFYPKDDGSVSRHDPRQKHFNFEASNPDGSRIGDKQAYGPGDED
jgi:hypothetical protein